MDEILKKIIRTDKDLLSLREEFHTYYRTGIHSYRNEINSLKEKYDLHRGLLWSYFGIILLVVNLFRFDVLKWSDNDLFYFIIGGSIALIGWGIYYSYQHYDSLKKVIPVSKTVNDLEKKIVKKEGVLNKLEKEYHTALKSYFIKNFDKNKNGKLDVIEDCDDYFNLLTKNQDKIIKISEKMGIEYLDYLIKINEKLKLKKESLNLTLERIVNFKSGFDKNSNINQFEIYLNQEIYSYNLLLANSLFMASSLINNDRITFRTIYEKFDKLNFFNSNFENQTIDLLKNVNKKLSDLLIKIDELNESFREGFEKLIHATNENTKQLKDELNKINSSINVNNLIAGINAYQNYKTNQNTKSLKS